MARLKVAVVGAGYFSRFHYDAWSRMPDVELIALCDRDGAKAGEVAQSFAVPEVFRDLATLLRETSPDLIDIVTPPNTHAAVCREIAARAIPMICQKAFCTSLDEAGETVAAVAATGTMLVIHENFRFQPWHRRAKALIEQGVLGDLQQLTFRLRPGDGRGAEAYLERQPYFQRMERFLVHETLIHQLDTFRYFAGEISGVFARLAKLNPVIAGEDAGLIVIDFANGVRGLIDGNRLADHAAANRRLTMGEMLIEGTRATLRLDGDGALHMRAFGENDERSVEFAWEDRGFGGDCVYALSRHVVDHLTTGTPLENTGAAYLANLAVEEAVYRAHDEQRYIALPPVTA
ncbi:MAG: Gfo/Idh/MocA family oxidoreductase [Pseudomonadota bacterium]